MGGYRAVAALFLVAFACLVGAEKVLPPLPPDDWRGTDFESAPSASVRDEDPFDPARHAAITPSGEACSDKLNEAIYRQDVLHGEAAEAGAPTLGIFFVLAHELAHLSTNTSSFYAGVDHVLDLSLTPEKKLRILRESCESGLSFRAREAEADGVALAVARERAAEISRRWPAQGSVPWLISQAGHFATNLFRWNNDWPEGPEVTTPEVFLMNPDGGLIEVGEEEMKHIDDPRPPSGKTAEEIDLAARQFLCAVVGNTEGHWDVLVQSGSTHGTLAARLNVILAQLRPAPVGDDPVSRLEAMVGRMGDYAVRRHATYLEELEGRLCELLSGAGD